MTNNHNYNFDLEGHYLPESVRCFIEGFIQQFIADKQKSEASKRFDYPRIANTLALQDFFFLMRDRYGCYVTINLLFDIVDFQVIITLRKEKKMEVKISKSDFIEKQKEIARKIPLRLSFESKCVLAMYQTMLQLELFPKEGEENDTRNAE